MKIPITVAVNGIRSRIDTLDLPMGDPPAAAERRDLLALIALMVFASHDLQVEVVVNGLELEVKLPHATVTATLPGRLDAHNVRAAAVSVGLRVEG